MISFLPLSLLEKVVVWIIVNNQSKFYEVFFYSSKMEDNNGLKVCWTPNNHFSSKIFSFSAEKKLSERKTDEQIYYTHAAADIYDDGGIRRVVVIVIAIVERILENESRVASSARTIHATSGGASESFLGDEFYTRGRQKKK